ncbi:MAG: DUF4838 domain-containing protein [Planctomycetia bacterium]|nr:DUF4838 domain-containing protein [Planctomycetia bacterium]
MRDGQPTATIVTAAAATDAAAFSAQELQYHVQKITGTVLPIKSDAEMVEGARILVGPSAAAAQLGVEPSQFKDQEYLIRFVDNTLILLGKDAPSCENVGKVKNWSTPTGGVRIAPPAMFEDQATSYAVHDFLERFCDVRWYGPGESETVFPKTATLVVQPREIRRAPVLGYRHPYGPMEIISEQWNHPSPQDIALFWARLRAGGEKYSCNHSFGGYYDRFWAKNPKSPEMFHPDWFAQGYPGQPPQMCYSNQGFIDQVVADARKFFDDQGAVAGAQAMGKYFGLVPMDTYLCWCKCPACQAQLEPRQNGPDDGIGYFSNGIASDYFFAFANRVAREVAKTHPDKYLSTLAYAEYAYYPRKVRLEPNISVQMCLHVRNWWAPGMEENDLRFYRDWVSHEKGRPLYVWLYYCFPEQTGAPPFHCFPGFSAHNLDRQIKMFARDGIRGAFLNNIGEQVDHYVTLKLFDDPSLDVNALLEEFFTRYYGPAAGPMQRLYLRIEEIFSNPVNYPEEVQKARNKHFHQTEEMAWKYLGTEARMAELGALMDEATRLAVGDVEKQRVALFRKAIWDYMVDGRKQYLARQQEKAR